MANVGHGIGSVSHLTGVSQQVLRTWEKRYNLVSPQRTSTGRRLYSQADIDHIEKCSRAVRLGFRIGNIAELSDDQIDRLLAQVDPVKPDDSPDLACRLIIRFDDGGFTRLLDRKAVSLGPHEFCQWCVRLLIAVGDRWACGDLSVAAEHWGSAHIKSVLLSLLRVGHDRPAPVHMCFATVPGELHELGTLMAGVCAKDAGAEATYMGPNLPVEDLAAAAIACRADAIGLGAVIVQSRDVTEIIDRLRSSLPNRVEIWVGGPAVADVQSSPGVRIIRDFKELRQLVTRRLARVCTPKPK